MNKLYKQTKTALKHAYSIVSYGAVALRLRAPPSGLTFYLSCKQALYRKMFGMKKVIQFIIYISLAGIFFLPQK
jgi:hypothetical protein